MADAIPMVQDIVAITMHLQKEIAVDRAHEPCGAHETALIPRHFRPGQFGFCKMGIGPLRLKIQEMSHCR